MSILSSVRKFTPQLIWNVLAGAKREYVKHKYLSGGRKEVKAESSKAYNRRAGENFFEKFCSGKGLDIGFGGDLIKPDAQGFDFEHGDAHFLEGIENESFDYVYSSHTLEHMIDAQCALKNWFRVVKPGGYLIVYIPHRDLYEKKRTLPSRFNPTHKNFFILENHEPPNTLGLKQLIEESLKDFELIYIKECSEGYKSNGEDKHSSGEYSIEAVIQKVKN